MSITGQRIQALRKAIAVTQQQLSEELGISCKSVQRYERGYSNPDTYTLSLLATYFDVSSDYLLGIETIEERLRIECRVFMLGEHNPLYEQYLKCKNTYKVHDAEYYWISYNKHSKRNRIISGQTQWVGWADDSYKYEIRRLRPIIPEKVIELCKEARIPLLVLNSEQDAKIFTIFGGNAIVRKDVCIEYLPEFNKDFVVESSTANM